MSSVHSPKRTKSNKNTSSNSRKKSKCDKISSYCNTRSKDTSNKLEHKLINVVRMFPMLYDVRYKLSNKETELKWSEVGSRMRVKGCKQKWFTLLDNYRKNNLTPELMKLMSSVYSSKRTKSNKNTLSNSGKKSKCGKISSYCNIQSKGTSNQLEHELINVVRMFPMLYDVRYKSSNEETELKWSEVGARMRVKGCKQKWFTLLDSYRKNNLTPELMKLMCFVDSCETTNRNKNVLNSTETIETLKYNKTKYSHNASEEINKNLVDSPTSYVEESTPEEFVSSKNHFQENINNALQNVPSHSSFNSNTEAVFPCNNTHSEFVTYDSEEREEMDEVLSSTGSKNSNHTQTLSMDDKKSKILQEEEEVPRKKKKLDEYNNLSFSNFLEYIHYICEDFRPSLLNKVKLNIFLAVCAAERVMLKEQQA